jgi:hypothetical protein
VSYYAVIRDAGPAWTDGMSACEQPGVADHAAFMNALELRHDGGVVNDAPGMGAVGLPFLRRRRSSFVHGAGPDTADLSAHLHQLVGGGSG